MLKFDAWVFDALPNKILFRPFVIIILNDYLFHHVGINHVSNASVFKRISLCSCVCESQLSPKCTTIQGRHFKQLHGRKNLLR